MSKKGLITIQYRNNIESSPTFHLPLIDAVRQRMEFIQGVNYGESTLRVGTAGNYTIRKKA